MHEAHEETKRPPLYSWHLAHGAQIGTFAGWTMPLWYPRGAVTEHRINITNAGMFDTSHMSAVAIGGPGAFDLLQLCFTKDLNACVGKKKAPLTPGRCVYGAFLDEQGWVIDDAIVYQIGTENYMTVVNACMGRAIERHLRAHTGGLEVNIADISETVGKFDLQGPLSAKILMKVLKDPENVLRDMAYFSFEGNFEAEPGSAETVLKDGTSILLSRTGYTGEFGFEVFVNRAHVSRVWDTIWHAGRDFGALPCGLAARDSLRTGACLPLSHQDIGPWPFINHPWSFALPYNEDCTAFTKKFIGDRVLELRDKAEHTYAFVGYDPRKVSIHDRAVVHDSRGNQIGIVLTCVSDMSIARYNGTIYSIASPAKPDNFKPRGLSCGFVKVRPRLVAGQEVELKDSRRRIKVMIVEDIRPDRSARCPIQQMMR